MDFEGLVYRVLPAVKGTSARGEWVKQELILDLPGEFSRKLCVSFWGDRAREVENLKEGEAVTVSGNVESKEFNGRWFTEVRAWRVSRKASETGLSGEAAGAGVAGGGIATATAAASPWSSDDDPDGSASQVDDLPF